MPPSVTIRTLEVAAEEAAGVAAAEVAAAEFGFSGEVVTVLGLLLSVRD